jgi:TetR/AcrR family tetracycline transcriptional repressor
MRYHRDDIVDRAIDLLDEVGLDALSMRRLAAELGVQPSALYHHFQGKQELLGAVADAILERGRRPTEVVTWQAELMLVCVELRDIMLRHRDGAALVALVHSFGTGAAEPLRRMSAALAWAGADDELARVGARTLLHYVFGHVAGEQAQRERSDADAAAEADFARGLGVILDGLTTQMRAVGAVS